MGSERGDEYKKPCSLGEGTGSKESDDSEAPQRATASRLVPTHQGEARANPLARRGHSRDHHPDCKQVCIGLVVSRDGMPLGYQVFAGNRVDVTTVEEIVGTMEACYGKAQRVWVMDRGMVSADNIAWLQASERRYLVGGLKSDLKKVAPQLADARDWRHVRDGIEAKVCLGPDGIEMFLLVRSADRQQKEQAMHRRFCTRIETGSRASSVDSSQPAVRSTRAPPNVKSAGCSAATRAPLHGTRSGFSTIPHCRAACDSTGVPGPSGTTGRDTAKAATCCAPTSGTGATRSSGKPTSS
jgi:hypothetical protein